MRQRHLPIDPPEGCQWKMRRWYGNLSGLYLVESTRALHSSSVADLYYYDHPLPPSLVKHDGSPTHSVGDTCITAFGHEQINHPDDVRAASKRLAKRFRTFSKERDRLAKLAVVRDRKQRELDAALSATAPQEGNNP